RSAAGAAISTCLGSASVPWMLSHIAAERAAVRAHRRTVFRPAENRRTNRPRRRARAMASIVSSPSPFLALSQRGGGGRRRERIRGIRSEPCRAGSALARRPGGLDAAGCHTAVAPPPRQGPPPPLAPP